MFGANQSDIYWAEMKQDEFEQNISFWKSVRLGQFVFTLFALIYVPQKPSYPERICLQTARPLEILREESFTHLTYFYYS